MDINVVEDFENKIAQFFNAPYAITTDSCTHAIELCLRYTHAEFINVPTHTYLSIPFLADKLNISMQWTDNQWKDYYYLTNDVIDAAVLWKLNSYIPTTFMCISFQFQKHLSLGRGGIILTDSKTSWLKLKKLSYDGRVPGIPWREQNITSKGYHYYMAPETAQLGIDKLENAINTVPRQWTIEDWPDLRQMDVFKNYKK
jgi:dTDP-4-amino-4,6-dideoxygalactose transaminase